MTRFRYSSIGDSDIYSNGRIDSYHVLPVLITMRTVVYDIYVTDTAFCCSHYRRLYQIFRFCLSV